MPRGNVGTVGGTDVSSSDGLALSDTVHAVHDLRRTAIARLHEAGFDTDWIEKCLAYEQRGVRATYNKAEYAEQRRAMLQASADMLDCWIKDAPISVVGR
jgi:hypothetical protein